MRQQIIQACWLDGNDYSFCEYCSNNGGKTYLPLTKSTLNPAHICEECAKEHEIIGWFDNEKDYRKALLEKQK